MISKCYLNFYFCYIYFKYDVIIGFTTYIVAASCNYNNKMPECMLSNQLTFQPRILHFCKK